MMLQKVKDLNAEMEDAAVGIRKYCKSQNVPLEDRWAVAVEAEWAFPENKERGDLRPFSDAESQNMGVRPFCLAAILV